tara:strand:+ start:29840 stop:30772 length:933 start_codon:yes stop_codon:yes gene_type:complete
MKILVYESISAKSSTDYIEKNLKEGEPSSLLSQGLGMRNSLISDLQEIPGIEIIIGKHKTKETLREFMQRVKPLIDFAWIIAPETNGEIIDCFCNLADKIWVGCSLEALKISSDKRKTNAILREANICVPNEVSLNEINKCPYTNLVRKPIDGAGSLGAFKIEKKYEFFNIKRAYNYHNQYRSTLIEEWIEGIPLSVALHVKKKGVVLLRIMKQNIVVEHSGLINYYGVEDWISDKYSALYCELSRLLDQLCEIIPGLRGYIGIDFILKKNGSIVIIEINPRLTCSYVGLSKKLGRNMAEEILKDFKDDV